MRGLCKQFAVARREAGLRAALRALFRRDTYVFLWMIVCLCGLPHWVVGHGAVMSAASVGTMAVHLWKTR